MLKFEMQIRFVQASFHCTDMLESSINFGRVSVTITYKIMIPFATSQKCQYLSILSSIIVGGAQDKPYHISS